MKIERLFELAYIGTQYSIEDAKNKSNECWSLEEIKDAEATIQRMVREQNEILKTMMNNGYKCPVTEE